jgi:predicted phosphodiesterase
MKTAILSDIHANWYALDAVISHAKKKGCSTFWVLGDLVDRGPHPVEVVRWLKEKVAPEDWLIGNHDAMLMGMITEEQRSRVSPEVLKTLTIHRKFLEKNADIWEFLCNEINHERGKPLEKIHDGTVYILTHNGFKDPIGFYRYLYGYSGDLLLADEFTALMEISHEKALPAVGLYGHSHVSALLSAEQVDGKWVINRTKVVPFQRYLLDPGKLWMFNPGSVGSPRDLDNRAGYALLDSETRELIFYKVPYPWQKTQSDLIDGDYDPNLEERLRDAPHEEWASNEWVEHYQQIRLLEEKI